MTPWSGARHCRCAHRSIDLSVNIQRYLSTNPLYDVADCPHAARNGKTPQLGSIRLAQAPVDHYTGIRAVPFAWRRLGDQIGGTSSVTSFKTFVMASRLFSSD